MLTLFAKSCPPRVVILFDDYGFALFDEATPPNSNALARSQSGRELSKWAFANGALNVKHDYDLRLEPSP
jgi:hypothetical protein